jgi:hypothetical protein
MKDRGISRQEVEFVLNEPEIIRPGNNADCLVITAHPDGRYIKLVVSKDIPEIIITAAD